MMKSRKIRLGALALAAILAVTASGLASPAQAAKKNKKITIGFVVHVVGNPFIQQIIDAAKMAAKDLGVTIKVTGPAGAEGDAQLTAVQNMAASGVDGIATSVPSASMVNGLNAIIKSGIPIVQFNGLGEGVNAPYVGEKSVESGRILGKMVLDKIGGTGAKGKVIVGNCYPGFPVLENRQKGVLESLKKASGVQIVGPSDVKVDAAANFAAWQGLLAANSDALAMVGLCAPDVESIGKVTKAASNSKVIGGGYDLTAGNLEALANGSAHISLGQTPFIQGYAPVYILVDSIRKGIKINKASFLNSGTEIVTATSVTEPFKLPALTFKELQAMATSKTKTRKYYEPVVKGYIKDWKKNLKPVSDESA
ncbi:MAG: sugar ABC transporter substrate-binding protein [Actinobacteria bacterium]|nr:sugar ABC transporter substrate-binding protein [Actinomycetota bacterium]